MTVSNEISWIQNAHRGFGHCRPEDDYLHTEGHPVGASATETYFFGFHVPEHRLHGTIYLWAHPNLKVLTGGVMIGTGFQPCSLAADYFNIHAYLALDEHVDPVSGLISLPGPLRVQPVKPFEQWRITLDDRTADTSFDLSFTAAMPPAVRADDKHFDQNMHVVGDLVLRGARIEVDCYEIRDRSWHNLRPETPLPTSPYNWLTLARGADFAMNLSLFDDLSLLPSAQGVLQVPAPALQDGWVYRDGALRRIVECAKRTERTSALRPMHHQIRAVDDEGRIYEIAGEIIAGNTWNGWPNQIWHRCLTRWTCNGLELWGDTQEVQWHEAVRQFRLA